MRLLLQILIVLASLGAGCAAAAAVLLLVGRIAPEPTTRNVIIAKFAVAAAFTAAFLLCLGLLLRLAKRLVR